MTFHDFWQSRKDIGLPHGPVEHELAQAAWDAALCAAQEASFESGKMQSAERITQSISDLHTWAKPTPPLS